MNKSLLLERVNSSLAIVFLIAAFVFARYMWKNWHEGYRFLRPAIAIFFVWVGDGYIRIVLWFTRHQVNKGIPSDISIWEIAVGYGILMSAVLCCIRVFSEVDDGHIPWIVALVLSAIVASVTTYV